MINRPKETPTKSPDSPFSGEGKGSGQMSSNSQRSFKETLEDIQRRRNQEELQFEGKKLLVLMKVITSWTLSKGVIQGTKILVEIKRVLSWGKDQTDTRNKEQKQPK